MKQIKNNRVVLAGAFFLGIFCSFLWGKVLIPKHATPQTINDGLMTYYVIYTTIVAIPIAIFSSANLWALSWMLILGCYFSGYAFIPYWGQLGPLDLIFMFIYTVPSIIVAFITRALKAGIKRYLIEKNI